jgi:hypothetical protein
MKSFKTTAAQGEISITRIEKMPSGMREVKPVAGKFIVGHSETGHHHVMTMEKARFFEPETQPAGMRILYAILDEPKELVHERGFDTHEPIRHEPGMYEFRSGREFDHYAELARKQAD